MLTLAFADNGHIIPLTALQLEEIISENDFKMLECRFNDCTVHVWHLRVPKHPVHP